MSIVESKVLSWPVDLDEYVWNSIEDVTLMMRLYNNVPLDVIASELWKTTNAVQIRRKQIAKQLFKNGRTLKNISTILRLTEDELKNIL